MTTPKPYKISVSDDLLSWIEQRIKTTRIPPGKTLPAKEAWSWGLPVDTASRIHEFWTTQYNWREVEKKLNNELRMFTLPIKEKDEQLTIHFVHHRADQKDAIPLLFLHGWPGSFLEVRKIIDKLTSPGAGQQAYHVVAPSLPGFGFSSYPSRPFSPMDMASTANKLMYALGYTKYVTQGGDWGSMIGRCMAMDFPESCVALHLNMVVATPPSALWHPLALGRLMLGAVAGTLGTYEKKMLERMQWWMKDEYGYSAIQGTKPQAVAYPLTDSPFGMMCWIRDKLEPLVDDDYTWDDEEVITWTMPYIINGTPGHAEIYKWAQGSRSTELNNHIFERIIPRSVPVGCSIFPKDACYIPRWWAACKLAGNITFWKEHDKGGHFASVEKPEELVEDIRTFTKTFDAKLMSKLTEKA